MQKKLLKFTTLCIISMFFSCSKGPFLQINSQQDCAGYSSDKQEIKCFSSVESNQELKLISFKITRGLNKDLMILDKAIVEKTAFHLAKIEKNYKLYKATSYYFRPEASMELFLNPDAEGKIKSIDVRLLCKEGFLQSCPDAKTIEGIRFYYTHNELK